MKIILYVKFSREIFTLLPQKHYNLKKITLFLYEQFLIITSIKPLTKPI